MQPVDLFQWRLKCGYRSQAKAAEALGVHRNTYSAMERGTAPIDTRTALACTALYHRLKPWGD